MQASLNKEIVPRFIDEYQTGGDEEAFAELLHPDFVDHCRPPGIAPGAEGVRQQFDGFRAGLPDFRARSCHGRRGQPRHHAQGLPRHPHGGILMGIPPTGREVEILVMDLVRVEDGRIVEHWNVVDRLGLLQQPGAIPAPETAATA